MQNLTSPPPPPLLSYVHVLRPSEPEKMVFVNVPVCCLSVCDRLDWPLVHFFLSQEMKVKFVSQPFLTNGSGFIYQTVFTKLKNPFSGQTMRDTKKC